MSSSRRLRLCKPFAAALLLLPPTAVRGFVLSSPRSLAGPAAVAAAPAAADTRLAAKKAKAKGRAKGRAKRKPAGGGGGGGFGRAAAAPPSSSSSSSSDDAFSAFPALDPEVRRTLVPALAGTSETSGPLDGEILDRLGQIYGFRAFNAPPAAVAPSAPSPGLGDLLATGGGPGGDGGGPLLASPSSLPEPLDLEALISSASGGGTPPPAPASSPPSPPLDLEGLPPFESFRVLHRDPLILAVDDFFTPDECSSYVRRAGGGGGGGGGEGDAVGKREEDDDDDDLDDLDDDAEDPFPPAVEVRSRTVGRDRDAREQRTSTTWFHHYRSTPELVGKATRLLGTGDIGRWEEPQVVRYRGGERFTWHLDALAPSEQDGRENGKGGGPGQRVATLLVYLTDPPRGGGGATLFRDLGGGGDDDNDGQPLRVDPRRGTALLFFPAAGGIEGAPFDVRTLHCGEAVGKEEGEEDGEGEGGREKWIAQLWLREGRYRPTAPPGNSHADAIGAINSYAAAYV